MYVIAADLCAEGVTETHGTDEQLCALIDEATRTIARATGWYFEPWQAEEALDGRETPSLEQPASSIHIDWFAVNGAAWPANSTALIVLGAWERPDVAVPRLTLRGGR